MRFDNIGNGRWSYLSAPDKFRRQKVVYSFEGNDEAAIALFVAHLWSNNYITIEEGDDNLINGELPVIG